MFKGLPHQGFEWHGAGWPLNASGCSERNKVVWKRRTLGRHKLTFRNGKWLHLQNMNISEHPGYLNHKFVHLLGNQAHVHTVALASTKHGSKNLLGANRQSLGGIRPGCHCWIMCSFKLSNLISTLSERALKERKIPQKSPPERGEPLFQFFLRRTQQQTRLINSSCILGWAQTTIDIYYLKHCLWSCN